MDVKIVFIAVAISLIGFKSKAQFNPQKADSLYTIVCRVCDQSNNVPLPFTSIYNKRSHEGIVTDTLGMFTTRVRQTDTLKISCLGYIPQKIDLNNYNLGRIKELNIRLNRRLFVLKTVDIKGISWKQFKTQVMNSKGPEEHPKLLTFTKEFERELVMSCPSLGIGIPSAEELQRAKLPKLEEKALQNDQIKQKYSKKMIQGLTGLKDNELIEFEGFCNFSQEYLFNTNEYSLIIAVLSKYDEFKQLKNKGLDWKKADYYN